MFTIIGKKAITKASSTRDVVPSPNHTMNSGASATLTHGYALAKQSHVEEGMARIQERNARAYISALVRHGYSRMLFCEMDALHGQWEQALEDLDDILLQDEQAGGGYSVAECHRLKGEWLLQLEADHQSQAEASFQQALTIARQQDSKWAELRAATSLARLWQQQNKCQDAYELLVPVYGWFMEGCDTTDLKDAKSLLEELEK